ncbi:methyl-accepting chemotaxis protein McpD [Parvularcula bermudensis HTCC2503]|uniref:Methyl-accepting chemotaxis protein McpD n=1 Tax=Parvularcula bermudensis (strain ATCC BAA-594 / HTCC2503 / KCTC 12087) TaxID=314260 RepID=E0TCA2_PARBH|nr:methyl-accepting chemotaxis protein [Parvularcula bermudensis]ADM08535.1 methyl-accepting chemotaxis protein McpD [Parvularcula bermudensis HTCC2503]
MTKSATLPVAAKLAMMSGGLTFIAASAAVIVAGGLSLPLQIGLFVTLAAVVGAGVFALTSSVMSPLKAISAHLDGIVAGKAEGDVPFKGRAGEIGVFADKLSLLALRVTSPEEREDMMMKMCAYETADAAIMIVNRDLVVTAVNRSTRDLFESNRELFKTHFPNFRPDNIIGMTIDDFHKNPSHQRQILSRPENLPYRSEITIGDCIFNLSVSAAYNEAGDYIGAILEWENVTQQRFSGAISQAVDANSAVIQFRPDGTVISANANFLNTMGYAEAEIVGKMHSIFVPDHVRSTEEHKSHWTRLAMGETLTGVFERKNKRGETVWIEGSYSPVLNSSGKVERVVKYARDITETLTRNKEQAAKLERASNEQQLVVSELTSALSRLSGGDLTAQITADFPGQYEGLKSDYNQAVDRLHQAFCDILENTQSITSGVSELSQASTDLSGRTENQAASLEQTAAALNQATQSVADTAKTAKQANKIVSETRAEATESGNIVREAIGKMGEIENSSKEISQIIGVIDEIAFQTNLLALNAGVEAARAGDAGRGFAVVASEVRALAQRSSDAAKEIKDLISTSGRHVTSGVELVGKAGSALGDIVTRVAEVSEMVASINGAAQEQSTGLSEVNAAVNDMDQVTQQNAAMVEESNAACHSLQTQIERLRSMMLRFKTRGATASQTTTVSSMPKADVVAQQRLAKSFAAGGGGAAAAVASGGGDDGWDDF